MRASDLTDLTVYQDFLALDGDGGNDGSVVRIGFGHEDDNMAVLQVYTGSGEAVEVCLSMDALRQMSVETGHLAHGR